MTRRRPIRLTTGAAVNPVWSPDGKLIVYAGPNVSAFAPLLAIKPDGTPVDLPRILAATASGCGSPRTAPR
jgi:Tol biopolymer transport system component